MTAPTPQDARIAALKTRLDLLRPQAPGSLQAFARWQDVEITYGSNAIEGNTLTRSETLTILEKGLAIGGKPLADHLEVLDHRDALAFVHALAATSEPIREHDVRAIHQFVLGRSSPNDAGTHSKQQRFLSGSSTALPPPAAVPALMGDLGQWLQTCPPTPEAAFEAHWRLAAIHPFADGNGRTARLLMNLLLLRGGYPPVAIGPDQRTAYLDALEAPRTRRRPGALRNLHARQAAWQPGTGGRGRGQRGGGPAHRQPREGRPVRALMP